MNTYFDTPVRNSENELQSKINIVNNSNLMNLFLKSISGLLAVIDEHRQLISLNKKYLEHLAIEDPEEVLGLRQGEILKCIHAYETPNGCGTTYFCQTCNAAIAIATSLAEDKTVEKNCSISVLKNGAAEDLFLRVKCEPVVIENTKFLLLFITDISKEQNRMMLERSFFHDFKNMLSGLAAANYMLSQGLKNEQVIQTIDSVTRSLIKELEVQSCLMNNDMLYYKSMQHTVNLKDLFETLKKLYQHHYAKLNKTLNFNSGSDKSCINTDGALLNRILCNMITNALEATKENGAVDVKWEKMGNRLKFTVHNEGCIDAKHQMRIFQRNFSTKKDMGRGIGTYSMKLFGEKFLEGDVGFTSTPESGTDFYISLPI